MKVTIVGGAGGVGASAIFSLLLTRRPYELVLIDPRAEMITSHVMDLEQTLELVPGGSVRAGDEADVLDADVLVVTAAAPLTVNTSRLVYLADNARIVDEVAELLHPDWGGVILLVTNPVDPLVTLLQRRTGLERRRVLGYTLNDTLRLRTGLALALGVEAGRVDAWVLGEHGDASVPLFDRVNVDGARQVVTADQRTAAEEFLRSWYVRHVALDSGRSSTWTTGLGTARMVAAIAEGDDEELWPASLVLEGEYGVTGVAVSVPVALGPDGVRRIHEWELADDDLTGIRASAELVRQAFDEVVAPVPSLFGSS